MKLSFVLLALIFSFVGFGHCLSLTDKYPFSHVLKEDPEGNPLYTLHWNFSAAEETIRFGVKVFTDGWVGLGISPNGGMVNSDVAMGWVDDSGQVYFEDRFAFEHSLPPIDPHQDWFLVSGTKEDGFTILEFWRKWITCDERDREIKTDTSRVIYAWNDVDNPANGLKYHGGNRGATNLNLLSGVTNPPANDDPSLIKSFTLAVSDVTIPSSNTTYWCAALEIPKEIQQQKKYIIKFSPKITPHDFEYVHHMLIYLCHRLDETEVGNSAPCDGTVGDTISECRQGSLIAGWAVGGAEFIYPEDVAYPLGGPGSSRYVVIEMHYDNPMMHSGIVDSSGIEFFYVSEPRPLEAGIITMGHHVNNAMIIPPHIERYDVFGKCGSLCTSEYFPPEGITIFGNLLHTHLIGEGLTLRVIRNTKECGGLEQLKPIDQNLQYDFNFQQFVVLPEKVTLYPGDIIILECNYDSSKRNGVALGGESTRDEMCLSFPVYYPRTALSACYSTPTIESFFPFVTEFIPPEHWDTVLESIIYNTTKVAKEQLNKYVDWTPEAAAALHDSLLNGEETSFCLSDEGIYTERRQKVVPDIKCPYDPPPVCP